MLIRIIHEPEFLLRIRILSNDLIWILIYFRANLMISFIYKKIKRVIDTQFIPFDDAYNSQNKLIINYTFLFVLYVLYIIKIAVLEELSLTSATVL